MTTEEKIKSFLDITVRDASAMADSMVNEYKQSLNHLFEEHKEAMTRQSENQLKVEKERAKRDANIELTRQQLHLRRKITRKQTALKDQLFEEVVEQLNEFMKTEEYTTLLINQITNALDFSKNQYVIIYIDPKDADKKEFLEEKTGATLTVSEYSFIGGVRAVVPYKNILIDNSFEKKIEAAKEKYVFGGISNE